MLENVIIALGARGGLPSQSMKVNTACAMISTVIRILPLFKE